MINNDILKRALTWSNTPHGIRVAFETDIQAIKSPDIKEAFALEQKKALETPKFFRGGPRTHWYDPQSNCIHVILENIRNEQELDRILLQEILRRRGLAGLVGEKTFDKIAYDAIMAQDEENRQSFLSYVSGNIKNQQDVIAAGKMFLKAKAEQRAKALNPRSQTNAEQVWFSLTKKFIKKNAPALFNFLSGRDPFWVAMKIREGITQYSFEQKTVAKAVSATESSVEDAIARQHVREVEGRCIDLGGHIVIGLPGQVFLTSAPWARSYPIVLPFSALYKEPDKNYTQRFVSSAYGLKKDKHPYSLLSLIHLKREMEQPVAVFKSIERNSGQVLMLPSVGGKVGGETGNFCVPVSPKEINVTREQGLFTNEHSGKWVNYIHSVYPKKDIGIVCWLSIPGLTSYLEDDFEHKWLQPATKRIEAEFDRLFQRARIKKPSAEDVREILKSVSADDYVDLRSKIAWFQDSVLNEAGLPRVYSVYRDVLESATKIVKEFENPKFISRQIEFQINNKPHLNMEPKNQLLSFIDSHPESLRRLAYLCVAKSPVFGRELPPINPTEYVADMSMDDLKETIMEHYPRLSNRAKGMIRAEYPDIPKYTIKDTAEYKEVASWFFRLSIDDKCHFLGFSDSDDAWTELVNWDPDGLAWNYDKDKMNRALDENFSRSDAEKLIEKYDAWKEDGLEKHSDSYRLATDMAMFMANNLNRVGIKTKVISEAEAKEELEKEYLLSKDGVEARNFSVRDIMNLSYTWNGEEVSMRGFAEQFMSEIKQKDRTMEDAERIAKAFIDAVKEDPEKAGMKMLKAENMANAFRFKLPDGTIYTPEHPMASSPEYETQKGLWLIYEGVLGEDTMREFIGLLSKNSPMSADERKRFSELESKVNGSSLMQDSLEVPASKVNENRVKDIRNLIQYFEGNEDYTWTEKALIVKGAMSFGYSEKKESDQTKVEIKNISDNNSVAVPVIGGEAAAVVEGLRKGLNFKDALVQARISLSKESKRSVARNFTGWKVYKQSDKEEDAVILNQDVAGTGWCTGGAVSTARSHLSGGDFHVYYEAGEPLIAIRTKDGRMAEPPRGAHEGQFCTSREEQIAFDYIRGDNGIVAGDDYIADIEDIRRIMSPNATPTDAFLMPDKRRYQNGEFGGDTKDWGNAVKERIKELVPQDVYERWRLGLYYGNEIEDACRNGNAVVLKGNIYLDGSSSLTLPVGVTQVGNIILEDSTSLTLPEGAKQVGDIWLNGFSSLTLPEGVTQVGNITLRGSSSLTLPEGVTQVGNITLEDSTSLTLPEGVTRVGYIRLYGSSSLTLPEGVTRVGNIELFGSSSLTLPEGVTTLGYIYLRGSSSLTLPKGIIQASGRLTLSPDSSLVFPDGFVLHNDLNSTMWYSPETINELLREHGEQKERSFQFRLSDGTVYGYQLGDTIYLTPKGINPNTPIHEYAHIWAKVYERLHPEEWDSLKEELKTFPLWNHIASSESYDFIKDENRLAGEVLATLVGNKGEELLVDTAKDVIESAYSRSVPDKEVQFAIQQFKDKLTNLAVKDVFNAEGMEYTGDVTLRVLKDFAEGKGLKIEKEDVEKLAAMAEFERNRIRTTEYIRKSNERFNEELQKQIDGKFDLEPHTYNLGYPGPILRSTGIPNLPIQVTSSKLNEKSNSDKHKYDLNEIKDLVQFMNTPVAVFSYGDGTLAQNIIVGIRHNDKHFLVGLSLNAHINGVALEVNSIRTVFPKDNHEWLTWIQEGKSRYLDKETIKVLIAQQRIHPADVNHLDLNLIAKIVDNFENPKVDEKYFIIDNWQYYGVFLDDRSQSVIEREFRDLIPSGWKKHADHITVQYNDYSQDAITKGRALSSKLGYDYSARIVAVGKSDTVIALKVEGVETANKIAHITLAVSPEGKPVDSNKITEWTPVNPIEINGVLGLSYKGKKYFQVLNDNEVVDFQISKDSLTQPKTNMANETLPIGNDTDDITLRKAALFTAWETREDNPYEFVVDLSRTELEEFLKNSFDKLNAEDKDIVTNILNKTPGYGEDFVDKRISGESHFRPDIETLLFDDLTVGGDVLDRSMFYIATRNMNEEQMQSLHDSVKEKVIAYYAGVYNDAPNVDMDKIEASTEKLLHSWFRPWTRLAGRLEYHLDKIQESEAGPVTLQHIEAEARSAIANPAYAPYIDKNLLGWILNRCVDYGLDYTMLPKDLQYEGAAENFRKYFPEYLTKPSKEAQSSLPEDFYSNFRQTMYGSEIISVQRTESPDYFLVYYNSNESDVGLGMVPEKYPILTDSLGNRLAFDRIQRDADANANHFFVLDDKIVVVGPSNNPDKLNPVIEINRDTKLYDSLFLSANTDTQAKMLRGYVDASTSHEVLSYTSSGVRYDGEKGVLDAVNAFESGAPEADKLLAKAFSDLNLIEKEDVFHLALSERAISFEELHELTKNEDFIKATSTEEKTIPDTAFESPEDMLQWMKIVETENLLGIPDSPGKNALESIYESALLMAEVEGKRTVEEMKDTFLSVAKQCRIGITAGPEQEFSLQDKLEAAYERGIIDINDTLLIKSNYTGEYGIVQVEAISDKLTDGKKRIIIEAFPIEECPVLTVDSKYNIRKAEYRGADDPRPTYNYSEDGSLLSISMKNSSTYSLSDAIKDMSKELTPELKEMNYLELSGLYETLIETSSALIGVEQCGFSKEVADASKAELQTLMLAVHSERETAKEELLNYMKWEKKTKTFFGRIFTGPFKHYRDIPQPEVLTSLSVEDIKHDSIPKSVVVNFAEEYAKDACLNLYPSTKPSREHHVTLQTRIVNENDISQIPQHFHRQLEVAGRIDGTIVADGENVVVQLDGDKLISLRPDDIYSSISAQIQHDGNGQFVEIDDKKYSLNDRLITAIAYGNGQYLGSTNEDRLYVVYDIKQQKLVKAEPFEKLNRERCARKAEENKAKKQSKGLTAAKENGNKKGRGGR